MEEKGLYNSKMTVISIIGYSTGMLCPSVAVYMVEGKTGIETTCIICRYVGQHCYLTPPWSNE